MRSAQLFLRTLHAHAAKLPHEIILKRERERESKLRARQIATSSSAKSEKVDVITHYVLPKSP